LKQRGKGKDFEKISIQAQQGRANKKPEQSMPRFPKINNSLL
jgi:hypothetical protein